MANSSRLVLPIDDRARGGRCARRRWRRTAAASPRGSATSTSSGSRLRAHVVLEGDGHPGQRAGIFAGGDPRRSRRPRAASSASTRLNACSSPRARRSRPGAPRRRPAVSVAAAHGRRDVDAVATVTAPPRGSAARGNVRLRPRAPRQHLVAIERRPTTSGRNTLRSGSGCAIASTPSTSSASTSLACSSMSASWPVKMSSSSSVSSSRASSATWATSSRVSRFAMGSPS